MFKTLSSLLSTFFFFAVIGFVIVISSLWKYAGELPDYHQLEKYEPPVTTRLYAGDGRLLMEYAAEKRFSFRSTKFPSRLKTLLSPPKTKISIRTAALTMSALSARCSATSKHRQRQASRRRFDHYPAGGQKHAAFFRAFLYPQD